MPCIVVSRIFPDSFFLAYCVGLPTLQAGLIRSVNAVDCDHNKLGYFNIDCDSGASSNFTLKSLALYPDWAVRVISIKITPLIGSNLIGRDLMAVLSAEPR